MLEYETPDGGKVCVLKSAVIGVHIDGDGFLSLRVRNIGFVYIKGDYDQVKQEIKNFNGVPD